MVAPGAIDVSLLAGMAVRQVHMDQVGRDRAELPRGVAG
jgi:hypothetical protein